MAILHDRFIPAVIFLVGFTAFLFERQRPCSDRQDFSISRTSQCKWCKVKVVAFLNPAMPQVFSKSLSAVGPVRGKSGHALLVKELQQISEQSSAFVDFLTTLADSGRVDGIRKYWIADAVSFTVARDLLPTIAAHPDLHYLVEDQPLELVEPVDKSVIVIGLRW